MGRENIDASEAALKKMRIIADYMDMRGVSAGIPFVDPKAGLMESVKTDILRFILEITGPAESITTGGVCYINQYLGYDLDKPGLKFIQKTLAESGEQHIFLLLPFFIAMDKVYGINIISVTYIQTIAILAMGYLDRQELTSLEEQVKCSSYILSCTELTEKILEEKIDFDPLLGIRGEIRDQFIILVERYRKNNAQEMDQLFGEMERTLCATISASEREETEDYRSETVRESEREETGDYRSETAWESEREETEDYRSETLRESEREETEDYRSETTWESEPEQGAGDGGSVTETSGNLEDISFREIENRFLLVKNVDARTLMVMDKMGYHVRQDDNAIVVYGYIDMEAGISFELLCAACVYMDGAVSLEPRNNSATMKLRYKSFTGEVVPYPDPGQMAPFRDIALQIKRNYIASSDIMALRKIEALDPYRAPGFPDDIMVIFMKKGCRNEGIWCRPVKLDRIRKVIQMRMLNEPHAAMGRHKGDIVNVSLVQHDDGDVRAYVQL